MKTDDEIIRENLRAMQRPISPRRRSNATGHTTKRIGRQEAIAFEVEPEQVAARREDARRHGFSAIEYTNDGRCVMPSFGSERKRYIKHMGLVDRSAG